jgi:hypothetical protein
MPHAVEGFFGGFADALDQLFDTVRERAAEPIAVPSRVGAERGDRTSKARLGDMPVGQILRDIGRDSGGLAGLGSATVEPSGDVVESEANRGAHEVVL